MIPLYPAASGGHKDVVTVLLNGANVYVQDNEMRTPLHHAVNIGQTAVVSTLLLKMPTILQQDKDGLTVLHYAGAKAEIELVRILLEAKADVTVSTNFGSTVLHYAVAEGPAIKDKRRCDCNY